MISACF